MTAPAMTLAEAAAAMTPPIPRRELARRLASVEPVGIRYGSGRGRRPATYAVADILRAHTAWVRSRRPGKRNNAAHLADLDLACQNSAQEQCVRR